MKYEIYFVDSVYKKAYMVCLFQTMYILHYMIRYTNTIIHVYHKNTCAHICLPYTYITTYTYVSYTYISV